MTGTAGPDISYAYDAVLLAGFGGPEGPDDVMPFLRNVTRGRGIPEERLVEVSHHYLALGGVSPINAQNRALRTALEAELARRGVTVAVLWGNRNWSPYLADTVEVAAGQRLSRLLGLATSAYSSYSGCRQYREDFGKALLETGLVGALTIDKIAPYFDRRGFFEPFADAVLAEVRRAMAEGHPRDRIQIVFTTHSIPLAMAGTAGSATLDDHTGGGAYVRQHLFVARTVIADVAGRTGDLSWQLAYQSRSGPPAVPWLEPDINEVIAGLPERGRSAVIVVPIGFISDHVEVVWDLDHEAHDTAAEHGLFFARVPTPGTDARFVAMLADLVEARLTGRPSRSEAVTGAPRPDFCAPQCCANQRGHRPTTAGVDSRTDWAETGIEDARLAASGILDGMSTPATMPGGRR